MVGGASPNSKATSRMNIQHSPSRSAIRTAEIILMIVILFLVSWTPYAIVTLVGQFGDARIVTAWVQTVPAFFAKVSHINDGLIARTHIV